MDVIDDHVGPIPHRKTDEILADIDFDTQFEVNFRGYLDDKNPMNDFDTQDEINNEIDKHYGF